MVARRDPTVEHVRQRLGLGDQGDKLKSLRQWVDASAFGPLPERPKELSARM